MADLHRRAAANTTRLTPEEITNRGFASAFRGVSETEVRNFLRRVADEMVAMRDREADLLRQVEDLREQIRNPAPVTEEQLLSSLGEETARVLRSAQDAAEEIRKRSEERAGTLVREAQEESGRLREEAAQHAAARTETAEQTAAELEAEATARAAQLREEAEQEADALRELTARETGEVREQAAAIAESEIETAKTSGRALVEEARTVRERVLADLGRRRSLLQAQVDELRSGRDRLLDAYRVVKRTLSDATDALAQVEARANAELAAPPQHVSVPPVEGELEMLESVPGRAAASNEVDVTEIDLERETVVVIDEPDAEATAVSENGRSADTPDAEDSGAAVDALFARLRASHTADPGPASSLPAPAPAAASTSPETPAESPAEAPPAAEAPTPGDQEPASVVAVTPAAEGRSEALTPDDALRVERAEILEPLARDLARRAKRALQDQQNELLDKIRTIKGKVDPTEVLPATEEQEAAWGRVLEEPLSSAYGTAYSGLAEDGADAPPVPAELLAEIAKEMVEPWRQRLVSAIDGAAEDPDAITQRLGARYREYRGRELDDALGDALAAAWARGAFAAVPDGTMLRWVPAELGRCPDCDDNALEPTVRSAPFPTGQLFPPAHPGCRCFIARAEPVAATSERGKSAPPAPS
ncbi:MAG: DivIVA domain-containing protein [Acidimicrobiia bacterium]